MKTQVALERLTPDRLPVPPPPFPTASLYQVHFGTPMGGLPSAPLPVTVPNDQDAAPGEEVDLWYYDAAPFPGVPAGWRLAGKGTVSADGTRVVSNPGVGIARFCGVCGVFCMQRQQERQVNVRPDGLGGLWLVTGIGGQALGTLLYGTGLNFGMPLPIVLLLFGGALALGGLIAQRRLERRYIREIRAAHQ